MMDMNDAPDAPHSTADDFFLWHDVKIRQNDLVHKIGTDAVLLGSWTAEVVKDVSNILDAGTGTGVLALYFARQFPEASIQALDVQEEAIRLMSSNLSNSSFGNRIEIRHADFLKEEPTGDQLFQLVVSNPPYHQSTIKPDSPAKELAKHLEGEIAEWMGALCGHASAGGHICIVVPSASAMSWVASANHLGWYVADKANVFSFPYDAMPKRALLHFSKTLQQPSFRRINIYTAPGVYTTEYLQLTGIQPSLQKPTIV